VRVLFLETELLYERAVCALVGTFEILQMLASVCHQAQKTAAGVFVLVIFVQMSGQFLDTARQNSHLHLRGPRIGVVALCLRDLICLLSLRKHR
jgi:hypothetical protein